MLPSSHRKAATGTPDTKPAPEQGLGPSAHLAYLFLSHCTSTTNLGLSAGLDAGSLLTSALVPQQEDNMAFGKPAK